MLADLPLTLRALLQHPSPIEQKDLALWSHPLTLLLPEDRWFPFFVESLELKPIFFSFKIWRHAVCRGKKSSAQISTEWCMRFSYYHNILGYKHLIAFHLSISVSTTSKQPWCLQNSSSTSCCVQLRISHRRKHCRLVYSPQIYWARCGCF